MACFEESELDWWSKYWASVESEKGDKKALENGSVPNEADRFIPSRLAQMRALKVDKSYGRNNSVCCVLSIGISLPSQANRKSPRRVAPPPKTNKLKVYADELEKNFGDFQVGDSVCLHNKNANRTLSQRMNYYAARMTVHRCMNDTSAGE